MRTNAGVGLGITVWSNGLGVEEVQVCISNILGRRMETGGQGLPRRQRDVRLSERIDRRSLGLVERKG